MRPSPFASLEPFGYAYSTFHHAIEGMLVNRNDDDLRALITLCEQVRQDNAWWASYQAAPVIAGEARRILYTREKERRSLPVSGCVEGALA